MRLAVHLVHRHRHLFENRVPHLLGVLAKGQLGDDAIDQVAVNGALGFAVYQQGELATVASVTVAGGRVTRLDLVRAPGKLPRLTR